MGFPAMNLNSTHGFNTLEARAIQLFPWTDLGRGSLHIQIQVQWLKVLSSEFDELKFSWQVLMT